MPDSTALALARRDLDRRHAALAADAQHLADAAARFAAHANADAPSSGEASRLAQEALQLALAEARLVSLTETVEYLEAAEAAREGA